MNEDEECTFSKTGTWLKTENLKRYVIQKSLQLLNGAGENMICDLFNLLFWLQRPLGKPLYGRIPRDTVFAANTFVLITVNLQ